MTLKSVLMLVFMAGAVAAPAQEKENSDLAGTEACTVCHTEENNLWKSSKHAGANGMGTANPSWTKDGVGCEACHGPGQEHMANPGDKAKIVAGKEADICGQCHSANLTGQDAWSAGYRPGMKLSDIKQLQLIPVDPDKIPPEPGPNQRLTYNMWLASGHSKALSRIRNNSRATADCYGCHSAEGFAAKRQGKTVDVSQAENFHTLTCVACHDPHGSSHPHQLVMAPEDLCSSCHTQRAVLQGKGAKGIEETRSFHSAVDCFSCHMTEGNHLMKVIRPDDPDLPESRTDTCTGCHRDNNRKARAKQLSDWQAWYKETMDPIQADLDAIDAALKENPDLLDDTLKSKLNDVRSNLGIIIRDGSNGAHNLDYALEIMSLASSDLKEIKAAVK